MSQFTITIVKEVPEVIISAPGPQGAGGGKTVLEGDGITVTDAPTTSTVALDVPYAKSILAQRFPESLNDGYLQAINYHADSLQIRVTTNWTGFEDGDSDLGQSRIFVIQRHVGDGQGRDMVVLYAGATDRNEFTNRSDSFLELGTWVHVRQPGVSPGDPAGTQTESRLYVHAPGYLSGAGWYETSPTMTAGLVLGRVNPATAGSVGQVQIVTGVASGRHTMGWTTLGSVASESVVPVAKGGTGATTNGGALANLLPFGSAGTLLVCTGSGLWSAVPIGPDGYVLTADSGETEGVSWQPSGGGGGVSDGDKGDVVVSSSGAVWTIDNGVVSLAKMANVATGTVFYRKTAGTGSPEVQTLATLKTDLGLTGSNSGDQTITLTGDVTGSGTGSFAATIATSAVTPTKMSTAAKTFPVRAELFAVGQVAYVRMPVAGTVTDWTVTGYDSSGDPVSGSAVVDIWKDTDANYPPTSADTITASAKPTVTTASKATGSTLTGWTTTFNAGDWLAFKLDSVTTFYRVVIQITMTRS